MKTWAKVILLSLIVIAVATGEFFFVIVNNSIEHPVPCTSCPNPVPEWYIQQLEIYWVFLFIGNFLFSVVFTNIVKEAFPENTFSKWIFLFVIWLVMTVVVTYATLMMYYSW